MKNFIILAVITIAAGACSGIQTIAWHEQVILGIYTGGTKFASGAELGMVGARIKFERIEYDHKSKRMHVVGIVTDQQTLDPLPGFEVSVGEYDSSYYDVNIYLVRISDSDGKFDMSFVLRNKTFIAAQTRGYFGIAYELDNLIEVK